MTNILNTEVNDNAATEVNLIKVYLKDIGKYNLLSREEEMRLAEAASHGDVEAKNALINHNLRLSFSIAKTYMGRGIPLLDLVQEGNKGLIISVDKFDLSKGFRFSTYATYWIKQSISKAIMDQSRNIRIPVHVIELISNIRKFEKTFQQEHGRDPRTSEIAKALSIDEKKIKQAYYWMKDTTSLDVRVGDEDDVTVGSFVEDKTQSESFMSIEDEERSAAIEKILDTLNDREKVIIKRRFGIGQSRPETLEEIGKSLSLSRERVRQLEASALKKLRNPRRAAMLKEFI